MVQNIQTNIQCREETR